MDAIIYLTYLGVLILIGLIITFFSNRLKIPNILLLIISGMVINYAIRKYSEITGTKAIEFPVVFIASLSILALVMIVFDSTSQFKYKEFDDFSIAALKYSMIFLIANMVIFSAISFYFLETKNFFLALMFAALMSGTSPDAVLYMLKDANHKVLQFLKVESIVNTPLIVLFPFIILNIMVQFEGSTAFTHITMEIIPFFQQIASGIGAGLLIGLIILKLMRKIYSKTLSPLIIISAAILSFVLAENIGGNGVLSVTTLGLMFGNVYIKQKENLQQFSSTLSTFLEITVFILIGILINLPLEGMFYLKAGIMFVFYLLIRYITISYSFRKSNFNLRERLFISLNASKGIAVAVVAALLLSYTLNFKGKEILFTNIPGGQEILNYTLIFLVYSIIVSTISLKFAKFFIRRKIEQQEEIVIMDDKKKPKTPKAKKTEKQKKIKKRRIKKLQKKIKEIRKK